MNAEQHLYETLRPSVGVGVPPLVAAEYFVQVKLASGGLLPDEVTLLKEALSGQVDPAALQAAIEQAQMGGVTSGVRQSVAQDILHAAKMRRTGGERVGKELGTGAGALIGFLSGGASPAERAVRAGVGALVGKGAGKLVGQKIDTRRAMPAVPKQATIVKESAVNPMALARLRDALAAIDVDQLQDAATASGASGGAEGALGDTATLAGVMAGSNAPGRMKIPAMVAGGLLGKGAASLATREKRAAAIERVRAMMKKAQLDSPTAVMENEPMQDTYPVQQQAPSTRDTTGDALPAEPVLTPDQDLMPNPLDAILDMLQRGNEAEMYQQKAEDAEQVAQKAKADAELAKGELEAAQKQQEIAVQQHAEELHAARTQAAASGAESQAVQQQLMEGQTQLQTAQSQTVQLMQAMNAFRQQMIDLLAMDPTQQAVPGAMVPSPGGGQIMQDPAQQAGQLGMPGADAAAMGAGGPPAAPQEGTPPEQGGGEQAATGEESSPPKEESGSEPKKESAEPKKEPGDSKGVTVHVHGK